MSEQIRKVLKRNRGELIDLDYYKVANMLISKEAISENDHKRIKLSTSSDTAKMDSLLDLLDSQTQSSHTTFNGLVSAVEKQNPQLANKLLKENQENEEEREPNDIRLAEDIFEELEEDTDLILVSSAENIESTFNSQTSSGSNDTSNFESIDNYSTFSQQSNEKVAVISGKYTFLSACEYQKNIKSSDHKFQFSIPCAWIKSIETISFFSGTNLGYRGCSTRLTTNRTCKKKVSKSGGSFICERNHINAGYEFIPCLQRVVFEDPSGEMQLTLFDKDVEKVLGLPANQIEKLNREALTKVLQGLKSKVFKLQIRSNTTQKLAPYSQSLRGGSTGMRRPFTVWDNVATIIEQPHSIGSGIRS